VQVRYRFVAAVAPQTPWRHLTGAATILGSGSDAVGRDEATNRATMILLCPKKQYDIP
jgi:hypothetical protein